MCQPNSPRCGPSLYDQVWRLKYRGRKRQRWKSASTAGGTRPRISGASGKKRNKCALAGKPEPGSAKEQEPEQAQGAETASEDQDSIDHSSGDENAKKEARKRRREGDHAWEEVITVPIVQQRMPHTCVTSIWGDGTPGPLTFVFGEGTFPADKIETLNKKFEGEA